MDIATLVANTKDVKELRKMAKMSAFADSLPIIEARIAQLQAKPEWRCGELKMNDRGGYLLPSAVYGEGEEGVAALKSVRDRIDEVLNSPAKLALMRAWTKKA